MNSQTRQALLRRLLLKILSECPGLLLPEDTMYMEASLAIPELRKAEFDAELRWLEVNGYAAGIRPDMGGACKWKITDAGKLQL